MRQEAEGELRLDAARKLRCQADEAMTAQSERGDLAIRVPAGTTTLQAGKDIHIRGTGQGKIRIHNKGRKSVLMPMAMLS